MEHVCEHVEYRTKKALEQRESIYRRTTPPPERAFKSLVVNSLKGAYWREKEEGGRRSGGGREKGERRERERGIRLYTIHYRVNT